MSMSIENETQPLPPPCQRLVIRNLPFDVQEVDFLKYLSERKSCAAFLGSPANSSNGESAQPRMILTSFKNGKAACKHKGRGTVCATAFVLAENAIVATTLAAALDSIAFNATTDPTLLMSVEYSVYQEAPVAGNAGGRHEAAAAVAGSIFTDPEYLQFVESTSAAQTAADVTTSTVSRDSLAKYAEERTQELAGKRETLMVKELLDNWFKKIPFAWERRGQSKQASSNQLSSSTSRDGKRGSGDQPSTSSTATSAKKKKKDRHGKEKHPEVSDPALAAQQSKKKKDKSRKRDKKRKESSQGAPGDEGALSPEEIKRRAKREKDRERKSRKRREKSQAAVTGDGAIGLATAGEASTGKKSRKDRQSGRGTSTDKATSSTPHDTEDASGSKKKRRDRSKKHSDRTQEGSGPSEDDRKAEDKKKRRDRKRDKRSGEAPQRNADGSIVVDGQVYPKSKEREILDRERDREAKQRRIKEKEDRARRQEQVLKDANAKASRKQRNSAAVGAGGGDAPSAPGGNGDDAGKKNTFTVTNTRRGGASTRKDMPSLGDSGDATPSHAPQGVWGSKSTASVPSGGAGDDRRPPPPPPAAGKRVMMRRPPPPPADA